MFYSDVIIVNQFLSHTLISLGMNNNDRPDGNFNRNDRSRGNPNNQRGPRQQHWKDNNDDGSSPHKQMRNNRNYDGQKDNRKPR